MSVFRCYSASLISAEYAMKSNLLTLLSNRAVSRLNNVKSCASLANQEAHSDTRPITKDRTETIPVEVSIDYMQSDAYVRTYGDKPVWKPYRRNFKGGICPKKTRKTCIRQNMISTGSPCPICRDEFLIVDCRNTALLKQFICPETGAVLDVSVTGVCRAKHTKILVELRKAFDIGLIPFDVRFREYNYSEYMDK